VINLLPPQHKKDLAAGRTNTILVRYLWIIFALFSLLAAMSGLTYVVLSTEQANQQRERDASSQQIAENHAIEQRQKEFENNLMVAKTILDQQTHYSNVLLKLARLMQPGTILSSITLDHESYGTPMDINFSAKSEEDAIKLRNAFQSSDLFTNVQFKTLALNDAESSAYPVSVVMQVIINKEGAAK